ncbi:NAD(P)H nitroreductase [Pseudonocardia eucalypti]|uniref:NAD(P)H nitroreductase n=1 Tax=Pseudonocardia eucalypti TaxID=648755 RepID=A0ABP9QIB6_9PSEU|nr:nitroreductase [Pseudonocardia eucalypti]
MNAALIDHRTVSGALELASRAPSIHNSQPWHWYLGERSVHLYADLNRWLPATDADGRDMLLSCGAALHHLRIALATCGLRARVHRFPNLDEPDHLASVELHAAKSPETDLGLAAAITARRTDRRPFGDWPVPDAFLDRLVAAAAGQGTQLRILDDADQHSRVLRAVHAAARAQAEVPGYDTELALWTARHASADGIPARNLPPEDARSVPFARPFRGGELSYRAQLPDGARLLLLGATSDDRLSQLRAGEALSAVLLEATDLGLATCPLSQPLEIGDTRRYLRDRVLGGQLSPQLLIRTGWAPSGSELPATPRRPVAETAEPLPF